MFAATITTSTGTRVSGPNATRNGGGYRKGTS